MFFGMTVWIFLLAMFLAGFAAAVGWWLASRILGAILGAPYGAPNP